MIIHSLMTMPNFAVGGTLDGDCRWTRDSTYFHESCKTDVLGNFKSYGVQIYSKCPFVYFLNDDVRIRVDVLVYSNVEYDLSKAKATMIANLHIAPMFISGGYTVINMFKHKNYLTAAFKNFKMKPRRIGVL